MKSKTIVSIILVLLVLSIFSLAFVTSKKDEKIEVLVKYKKSSMSEIDITSLSNKEADVGKKSIKEVTKKEYQDLLDSDYIEKIQINHKVKVFLQDSVPLINADDSWNIQLNDINFTGINQTICIIDSGINYSHPDLGGCENIDNLSGDVENLTTPLESDHNYQDDEQRVYTINQTGFTEIAVHFVNISTEYYYDNITILDGNMNVITKYNDVYEDIWSPSVEGDTIYIRLESDEYINDYGFYIDKVINGSAYSWDNCDKVIGGWDFVNRDANPLDDHGHGTHVAGIAAADGGIKGVAPDAKIVSIKVIDDTGTGYTNDILDAIDWCVAYRNRYNISVISMSLGTDCDDNPDTCYINYCDGDEPFYSDSINAAVDAGLAVIVATGNDGNHTHISTPSCIQNAIPVSSSTKADAFSSFSNRNSLVKLLAPGSDINSTNLTISGLYDLKSGTSMATPHVSGAIALIKQFLDLTSQTKTPQEIESALEDSGVEINDSGKSNLNYSRIEVYSAIFSLENINPNLTLVSPADNILLGEGNKTFTCSATDWQLDNLSFYLWNDSSLMNTTVKDVQGEENETQVEIANMAEGTYYWGCQACDVEGNCIALNNTLYIGDVSVSLVSPADNIYTKNSEDFNCSAQAPVDKELKNITLMIWKNQLFYNITSNISGINNYSIFSYNINENGQYSWNCLAYNNESDFRFASTNRTIIYDEDNPEVTLDSPENDEDEYEEDENINFRYEVTDNFGIENCSLLIDGDIEETQTSGIGNGTTETIVYDFSTDGSYTWKIKCYDLAGNSDVSLSRDIEIQEAEDDGGSGSGSSSNSGWIYAEDDEEEDTRDKAEEDKKDSSKKQKNTEKTYTPNKTELEKGYTQELEEKDKIKFTITVNEEAENGTKQKEETHTLTVNKIENETANIIIESDPIDLNLSIGQEKKINLSSKDYYDVSVKLNNINNSKANITIKEIDKKFSLWISLKNTWNSIAGWTARYKVWVIAVTLILVLFVVNDVAEYYILKGRKIRRDNAKVVKLSELKKRKK